MFRQRYGTDLAQQLYVKTSSALKRFAYYATDTWSIKPADYESAMFESFSSLISDISIAPAAQQDGATDSEDLVWHFSKSRNSSKLLQTKALITCFEFCLLPRILDITIHSGQKLWKSPPNLPQGKGSAKADPLSFSYFRKTIFLIFD